MDKDGVFLTTAVLPLAVKYPVVARWRSPADGVAGLGGLNTVPRTHTHTHTHTTHIHTHTHTHIHTTHTFRDSTSVLYTTYWGENACV